MVSLFSVTVKKTFLVPRLYDNLPISAIQYLFKSLIYLEFILEYDKINMDPTWSSSKWVISCSNIAYTQSGDGAEIHECVRLLLTFEKMTFLLITMEDSLGDFERGFEGFKNSFKNWGIFFFLKLHCDPTVSLLGKYPEKTLLQKDTHAMFIAALFTIAKIWKQPECPSTEEWIKKMWYIYTMEDYSATKEN